MNHMDKYELEVLGFYGTMDNPLCVVEELWNVLDKLHSNLHCIIITGVLTKNLCVDLCF